MKLLLAAVSALTVAACASAAPEASAPVAPAQAQAPAAPVGMAIYEGTYALQMPDRVLDMRIWVDAQGRLNGELVGTGNQTTLRPTSTEHRFLHGENDNVWFQFTVENGRATRATMGRGDREATGPRKP